MCHGRKEPQAPQAAVQTESAPRAPDASPAPSPGALQEANSVLAKTTPQQALTNYVKERKQEDDVRDKAQVEGESIEESMRNILEKPVVPFGVRMANMGGDMFDPYKLVKEMEKDIRIARLREIVQNGNDEDRRKIYEAAAAQIEKYCAGMDPMEAVRMTSDGLPYFLLLQEAESGADSLALLSKAATVDQDLTQERMRTQGVQPEKHVHTPVAAIAAFCMRHSLEKIQHTPRIKTSLSAEKQTALDVFHKHMETDDARAKKFLQEAGPQMVQDGMATEEDLKRNMTEQERDQMLQLMGGSVYRLNDKEFYDREPFVLHTARMLANQ